MSSSEIYIKATQLIQSGESHAALALLEDKSDPRHKVIEVQLNQLEDKYDASIELSEIILNDPEFPIYDKAITYYWYSWNFLKIGNYEKARSIIDEGLQLVEELKDKEYFHAKAYLFNVKSVICKETGETTKALEYNIDGLEMAKQTPDLRLVASMTNNLASIKFFQGKYKESLELFFEAADVARESKNLRLEGLAFGNIGEIYHYLGDLDTGRKYIEKSLEITNQLNDLSGIANSLRKLGEIEFQRQQLNRAVEHLSKSIEIYEELNNELFLCFSYFSMIKVKLSRNEDVNDLIFDLEVRATKSMNQLIVQVYNLAQAIAHKNRNSLIERGRAMIYLEKIIHDKVILFETTYEATIHYVELLIQEYIVTEDQQKLKKVLEMVEGLYIQAQSKNASIKEIECLVLKSKLQSISLLFHSALESLNLAREISKESNLEQFTLIIDEELRQRYSELNRYQQLIDSNSSLLDKIQRSGVIDYLKFVGTRI